MSDTILISKTGLSETIKCTICKNPNQTERGCDGACQYDKELHAKIVEAVIGIAEQRPHGKWITTSNPNHSPFDNTSEFICICSKCTYSSGDRITAYWNYCPNCGIPMRKKVTKNE